MASVPRLLTLALLLGSLTLAACSPEAARPRNGGLGGDTGNRTADVQMHGDRGLNPYYRTPAKNPAAGR